MNKEKIRPPQTKSVKWWIPKLVFITIIICGFLAWVVFAYVCQGQRIWIPETTFWQRMGVCMGEIWYIPLVFGAIGVTLFILLEKRYCKKSE